MSHILRYWYLQSPSWTLHAFLQVINQLEGSFGVRDMLRNFTKPLFQDYTYQGRLVGMGIRLARIIGGLLFYVCTALLFIAGYLLWLAFPFLCLTAIAGSLLGPSAQTNQINAPTQNFQSFQVDEFE